MNGQRIGPNDWATWPWNRCRAVREPKPDQAFYGRCELRKGHDGDHALERGFHQPSWSTEWTDHRVGAHLTPPTGQPVTDADLEWWEAWHAALPVLQGPDSLAMATARLAAIVPRLIAALRTERAVVAAAEARIAELTAEVERADTARMETAHLNADLMVAVARSEASVQRVRDLCAKSLDPDELPYLGNGTLMESEVLAALDGPQ